VAFLHPKYFPFCIQDAGSIPTGNGTEYPLGMSLKAVMELYWKCKSYFINGSYAFSYNFDLGGGVQKFYIINDSYSSETRSLSYWPNTMSDMICSLPEFYGEGFGTGTIISPGNGETPYNSFPYYYTTIFNSLPEAPSIIKKEGLFYPKFVLVFAPALEYGAYYSTIQPTGGYFVSSPNFVSVVMADETSFCTMYASASGDPYYPGYSPQDLIFSGSITITKASDRTAE
jgi:hypothetical protein